MLELPQNTPHIHPFMPTPPFHHSPSKTAQPPSTTSKLTRIISSSQTAKRCSQTHLVTIKPIRIDPILPKKLELFFWGITEGQIKLDKLIKCLQKGNTSLLLEKLKAILKYFAASQCEATEIEQTDQISSKFLIILKRTKSRLYEIQQNLMTEIDYFDDFEISDSDQAEKENYPFDHTVYRYQQLETANQQLVQMIHTLKYAKSTFFLN